MKPKEMLLCRSCRFKRKEEEAPDQTMRQAYMTLYVPNEYMQDNKTITMTHIHTFLTRNALAYS